VLAGGDGRRLRSLVRVVHGDDRPKQFAAPDEGETLLRRTLRRLRLMVPPERTILVTRRDHDRYVREVMADQPSLRLFAQPEDRGTTAAILWPAQWVAAMDPGAVVAVIPSDHFVEDDQAFVSHIRGVVSALPDDRRTILLGARPTSADPGYGWIELGQPIRGPGGELFGVRSFVEKPVPTRAEECFSRGDLWNTMVVVAGAQALSELVRTALPSVGTALGPIARAADGASRAVERAYAACPTADFSRLVLEACPDRLLVSRLPAVSWADWGTPERVLRSLAGVGVRPWWAEEIAVGSSGSGRGGTP
jgi:mannose-1-phosphate guanylyltransferase